MTSLVSSNLTTIYRHIIIETQTVPPKLKVRPPSNVHNREEHDQDGYQQEGEEDTSDDVRTVDRHPSQLRLEQNIT